MEKARTAPTIRHLLGNGQPLPPHVEEARQVRSAHLQDLFDAVMGPATDADIDREYARSCVAAYYQADETLTRFAREAMQST